MPRPTTSTGDGVVWWCWATSGPRRTTQGCRLRAADLSAVQTAAHCFFCSLMRVSETLSETVSETLSLFLSRSHRLSQTLSDSLSGSPSDSLSNSLSDSLSDLSNSLGLSLKLSLRPILVPSDYLSDSLTDTPTDSQTLSETLRLLGGVWAASSSSSKSYLLCDFIHKHTGFTCFAVGRHGAVSTGPDYVEGRKGGKKEGQEGRKEGRNGRKERKGVQGRKGRKGRQAQKHEKSGNFKAPKTEVISILKNARFTRVEAKS